MIPPYLRKIKVLPSDKPALDEEWVKSLENIDPAVEDFMNTTKRAPLQLDNGNIDRPNFSGDYPDYKKEDTFVVSALSGDVKCVKGKTFHIRNLEDFKKWIIALHGGYIEICNPPGVSPRFAARVRKKTTSQ